MENKNDKFVTMIGFARRSGKIVYGLDSLKHAKNVKLLAVSDTASDNLVRNIERLADINEIPIVYAIGLELTVGNNVKALGLVDGNMAKAVAEYIEDGSTQYTIKYGKRR
ncbi:MAG: hypothetical protein K2J01_07480 [Clostridiales bacterium]|nr:hypothetical protein [Clostridiales bacterium]